MILVLSGLSVHWVLPQVRAASRDILGVSSALQGQTPDDVPLASSRYQLTITLGGLVFWFLLSCMSIGFLLWMMARLGAPAAWLWLLDRLPLLGAIWRWSRLAQFARLMEVLLGEAVPLPEALRLSGEAVRGSELAWACREAASRVEAGESMSASVAGLPQFPPTLVPFLEWGRETNHLGEAFRAAAEAFEARIRGQISLLESVLMPAMFLLVLGTIVMLASAILVPLVQSFRVLVGPW
jgi:type II secretory pathway component PulF